MDLVDKKIPIISDSLARKYYKIIEKKCFSFGLTQVHDCGVSEETIELIDQEQKDGKLKISGNLNFHGKAKDITFEADYKLTDKEINVSGGFPVSMTEFDVERPSLMLVKTDDILEIKFNVVFLKN